MLLILLEYLWDVCTLLTFLVYPLLVYKKVLSKKKFLVFLVLCLFFYEHQWSNTVFYALVWQFNYWLVYEMKFMEEHNAIGIYICYRFIQFIVNLYDGYIIYAFYLFIFVTMAYYCFSNKTRLLEMTMNGNYQR